MLYLTCTMIYSVDFAHYGVSRAKYRVFVSVDCGTNLLKSPMDFRTDITLCYFVS